MKILNLYAGIGGNRKLWDNVEVTAVEIDPKIAEIYQDFFPDDKMVIGDAHQYLLDHYKEFDFIWSSPPCPTHSRLRPLIQRNHNKIVYPDMKLYQEIIFLEHNFSGLYCVENVISYYNPLIKPQERDRHFFWANFLIRDIKTQAYNHQSGTVDYWQKQLGFNLSKYHGIDKKTILRNCVNPKLGAHILDCARGNTVIPLTEFTEASIRE